MSDATNKDVSNDILVKDVENPEAQHISSRQTAKKNQVAPAETKPKGFFGKIGDAFEKGYDATKEGITTIATKTKEGVVNLGAAITKPGEGVSTNGGDTNFFKKYGADLYNEAKAKITSLTDDLKSQISNNAWFQEVKLKLSRFVILKVEKIIDSQLNKVPAMVKKATDDPDMFGCVKRLKDDLIDEFYPDVRHEVMYMLKSNIEQPYLDIQPPERSCCLWAGLTAMRAWVLYTSDPIDMSIWKQLKTFSFWILQLIQAFPLYGVQTFYLFFYFLIMCKSDEFQLVFYIISFKKMQFISMGCLNGIIAYVQYFFCLSTAKGKGLVNYYDLNRCGAVTADVDPITYYIEIGTFFLKIFLVWVAFMLLPCSSKLGVPSFRIQSEEDKKIAEQEKQRCCNWGRGGSRLKKLMIWELIAELLTVGLFFILYYFVISDAKMSLRETIYFCQIVYGFLSFPFLVFAIPMMTTMLTKSRETKYDKYGRCVPNLPTLYAAKEKEEQRKLAMEQAKLRHKNRSGASGDDEDLLELLNDQEVDVFEDLEAPKK